MNTSDPITINDFLHSGRTPEKAAKMFETYTWIMNYLDTEGANDIEFALSLNRKLDEAMIRIMNEQNEEDKARELQDKEKETNKVTQGRKKIDNINVQQIVAT